MNQRTLGNRYAESLLEVAVERDCVKEMEEQITYLGELYREDEELKNLLQNPLLEPEQKKASVTDVLEEHFREEIINLVELVLEKNRSDQIPFIADAFDRLADQFYGVVRVQVTSAEPLTDQREEELENEIRRLLGNQEVDLTTEVDPDLIAGVEIRIGDYVLDGSLQGRIKNLRDAVQQSEGL